jgi:hypothetical protein
LLPATLDWSSSSSTVAVWKLCARPKGVARPTEIQVRGFDGESGEVDVTKRYPNLFREARHPQPGFVIVLFAHLAGQTHASV